MQPTVCLSLYMFFFFKSFTFILKHEKNNPLYINSENFRPFYGIFWDYNVNKYPCVIPQICARLLLLELWYERKLCIQDQKFYFYSWLFLLFFFFILYIACGVLEHRGTIERPTQFGHTCMKRRRSLAVCTPSNKNPVYCMMHKLLVDPLQVCLFLMQKYFWFSFLMYPPPSYYPSTSSVILFFSSFTPPPPPPLLRSTPHPTPSPPPSPLSSRPSLRPFVSQEARSGSGHFHTVCLMYADDNSLSTHSSAHASIFLHHPFPHPSSHSRFWPEGAAEEWVGRWGGVEKIELWLERRSGSGSTRKLTVIRNLHFFFLRNCIEIILRVTITNPLKTRVI